MKRALNTVSRAALGETLINSIARTPILTITQISNMLTGETP